MAKQPWSHLVRFRLNDGTVSFGQLITPLINGKIPEEISVNIATGDPVLGNIEQTGPEITIAREMLLAPIATCPIVSVIGVNYEIHMQETGQSVRLTPKTFIKDLSKEPLTAINWLTHLMLRLRAQRNLLSSTNLAGL